MLVRVGFDAHFATRPFTGNGRYTVGLLAELKERGRQRGMDILSYGPASTGTHFDRAVPYGRLGRLFVSLPQQLRADEVQVLHSQYTMPILRTTRKVLTIHDAAFARRGTPDYSRTRTELFSLFARRADVVITISESARTSLLRHLSGFDGTIHVVPNGVAVEEPTKEDEWHLREIFSQVTGPYVLYVGRMARRKRVPLLIQAFDQFRKSHEGTLLLVGSDDDASGEVDALMSGRHDIIRIKNVSESLKTALYRKAHVFVYLSEYEGFGLPVVEALRAGVPTVVSTADALVEVARGAAVVVRADAEEVADAIRECVLRPDIGLVRLGQQVAASYTWGHAAERTLDLYEGIL